MAAVVVVVVVPVIVGVFVVSCGDRDGDGGGGVVGEGVGGGQWRSDAAVVPTTETLHNSPREKGVKGEGGGGEKKPQLIAARKSFPLNVDYNSKIL